MRLGSSATCCLQRLRTRRCSFTWTTGSRPRRIQSSLVPHGLLCHKTHGLRNRLLEPVPRQGPFPRWPRQAQNKTLRLPQEKTALSPIRSPQSAIRDLQAPNKTLRWRPGWTAPPLIRNPQSDGKPPAPKPPPPRKPGINENYARELLELHTLGVDGGYTQKDVQEVARCFTGWTIDRPFQGGGFVFRPWMHDDGPKTVLGVTIPAGGGVNDGLRLIEILSRHPSTARFISKKLCQRFVSDDPPAQLVDRIAQVFMKTDGDIREVIRAIVNSPEFNSPTFFRSKVKSPLELAATAIRAVDAD